MSYIIGYARVSTEDQKLDAQIDALEKAGAQKIFQEKITGTRRDRQELDRMLEQLRSGDVVMVTKFDRLGRSLKDLIEIVQRINDAGADFRSLAEQIDTTTPHGRFTFHLFGAIAEFERDLISQRTHEGLAVARKAGRKGGRPPALSDEKKVEARKMLDGGESVAKVARLFGVSRKTIMRI